MVNNVKKEVKTYWDFRSQSYDDSPGHSGFVDIWRTVLSETFKGKMKILDVGCGTGFLSLILAELGHEVVGIDLSEGMLSKAEKKAGDLGLNIDFIIGDAENLPFDDGSFDIVVERHILWTLPNPDKAIKEWSRVIKNEGKLILIESEKKEENVGSHHYNEEIAKELPFSNGIDLEKFKEIANKCSLTFKVETLNCEKINLMIICE
ncbi:class I SAM-dependent methyltransferase [Methanothermococcus okinawensis]|uniref:Methyltransferase type 11 n=1 Tax=Methanothermococcus okinawensis (strain DSM 14208 / JCM 11175 / IH1) TaxID=647113 RepID=F8AMW3_METOI|nr:class I SAM-dependent methyltransferase [Methanothermococcus okinawensis]AEH06086.1 Methyltransferase type 11 [Methanothermococcus okinawensis IH1]